MKFSILTCTDGNNTIREEGITDKNNAFARFHYWCNLLFNDNTFEYGVIKVLDENLDCVEGKMELINRRQPEPTPEPVEPTEE